MTSAFTPEIEMPVGTIMREIFIFLLLPLTAGQLALIATPASGVANGQAIATLLQWFSWALPAMGLGIDVLKVVETGILPALHTAVAHKEPGGGQIGAGDLWWRVVGAAWMKGGRP